MSDGDVEPVGIVIADILPVHLARTQGDAAQDFQFLEAVGRHHRLVRRHLLRHRGTAVIL